MPTTILLIDNDAPLAREISEALEAQGYQVRVTGDGKEGLDLAREIQPAAIVLCVELPRMSGYSICQKLKKDEVLRAIPLVLTSGEASEETFEQHRKLKARAEDYLFKPFLPADLLAKVAALAGAPEAPVESLDDALEEVVSLEDELGLDGLAARRDEELPAFDLSSLPDEPALPGGAAALPGEDEDLRLLDSAFDSLAAGSVAAAPPAAADEPPALDARAGHAAPEEAGAVLDAPVEDGAAAAALDVLPLPSEPSTAGAGPEVELELEVPLAPPPGEPAAEPAPLDLAPELAAALDLEPTAAAGAVRGASAEALRAAGIRLLDDPPAAQPAPAIAPPLPGEPGASLADLGLAAAAAVAGGAALAASGAAVARLEADLADRRAALAARDEEVRRLHDQVDALTHRAVEAESAVAEREAESASQRARAEALAGQVRRLEADLKAGREEARRAADQLRAAEDRTRAAEALAAGAAEKARAAEALAATTADRLRTAEGQAAEAARAAEARQAELAAAVATVARLEGVEREVEELRTELVVARGEVEGAREEVEKRAAELQARVAELEAAGAKNEERVVKAYLKIKGDEKARDKARKALAIALQLLEEGLPPEAPGARPAQAAGKPE